MSEATKVFIQSVAVILVLIAGLVWWNWGWITTRSIRSDLNDYSRSVRRSMLDLEDKTKLLDEVDSLKQLLADGAAIDSARWGEIDDAIRDLSRYSIDEDDAILIARELNRAKREMEHP